MNLLVNGPKGAKVHLILAHGAGAAMDSPFMEAMATHLGERGIAVIRFEFPYMAERRSTGMKRPPNRMPVLLDWWRKVIETVGSAYNPVCLAIGGKSMGGRAASMVLAESDAPPSVSRLVTLGYPFHPPGRPDALRTAHFPTLKVPTLMVQGTRDPFGREEEVNHYTLPANSSVFWCKDGDHDLKPRRASGRTHDQALCEAADAVAVFLAS